MPELWTGTLSSFSIPPGFGLACLLASPASGGGSSPRLQRMSRPCPRRRAGAAHGVHPYAIAVLPTKLSAILWCSSAPSGRSSRTAPPVRTRWKHAGATTPAFFGLTGWAFQRQVVFPLRCRIFFRHGGRLGFSFILLTVAELFGANAGLGRFVQYYADFADYPKMVAGILYTGLITWLAMSALDAVKRRALFWVRA